MSEYQYMTDDNPYRFSNAMTAHSSPSQVTEVFVQLAQRTFASTEFNTTAFHKSLREMNGPTRVAWKYACSRGVTGTPIYFVNGMPVPQADASWTLAQWQRLIDPLVHVNRPTTVFDSLSFETLTDVRPTRPMFPFHEGAAQKFRCQAMALHACEIVPRAGESVHSMCCTKDEFCFPTAGCQSIH